MEQSASQTSWLYSGIVNHARFRPIPHRFRYRMFQLYLNLDEVESLLAHRWFWSYERFNLASFYRKDHMRDQNGSLQDAARDLVQERLGFRPEGPVCLLTHLRYGGFFMNPVAFYYCHHADGTIAALIAEVNNTPWNEQHCYVLPWNPEKAGCQTWECDKVFHVSPFMNLEMRYHWEVSPPDQTLMVGLKNEDQNGILFEARLQLQRYPITTRSLAWALCRYPFMTMR
ncbi:MAG: DUF1365 domain-containing protein, partial [Planctomycetaceae bacterium]|nr:DUF1365 domain-containing protein [Planctomycetaceae bacterium]